MPDFDRTAASRCVAVSGDLTQANLGICDSEIAQLKQQLHVIIHCAASLDFNERLDHAVELNVRGTMRLLDIAHQCRQIEVFVHVSTCYVNSNRPDGWIDEKLYVLPFDPEQKLAEIDRIPVGQLEVKAPNIVGDWPNTYTFTKCLTEHLLVKRRGTLPVCLIRPSIVTPALWEPVPGWVENVSGLGAVMMAAQLGLVKSMFGRSDTVGDIVPVDYVINVIMSSVSAVQRAPVGLVSVRPLSPPPRHLSDLTLLCAYCSCSGCYMYVIRVLL